MHALRTFVINIFDKQCTSRGAALLPNIYKPKETDGQGLKVWSTLDATLTILLKQMKVES